MCSFIYIRKRSRRETKLQFQDILLVKWAFEWFGHLVNTFCMYFFLRGVSKTPLYCQVYLFSQTDILNAPTTRFFFYRDLIFWKTIFIYRFRAKLNRKNSNSFFSTKKKFSKLNFFCFSKFFYIIKNLCVVDEIPVR